MKCLAAAMVLLLAFGTLYAEDWPQFRGPTRDGISTEKDLLAKWPEGGPEKLWTSAEIGSGWSSVAVVKDVVYTTGIFGGDLAVVSLDSVGKVRWKKVIGKATEGNGYKGARSTPTVDGDKLYVLSDSGVLFCLKTADGVEAWSVDLAQKYAARPPMWFYAESVLVDKNSVICSPGGNAALVALDKKTGKEIWVAGAKQATPTYASAVILTLGGTRQIVSFVATAVFGADAATGRLLWMHPFQNPAGVSATSVVSADGILFCTAGYIGCTGVKVEGSGKKFTASPAWKLPAPDDGFGGAVLINGVVYATGMQQPGFYAVELKTGKILQQLKTMGSASLIYAGGRIIAQGYAGTVSLLDPAGGQIDGSVRVPFEGKNMWAHPAVSNGRLYIRHGASLTCFNIKSQ